MTVTDLLAHTNYTFEIDATNGVSELSSPPRQFASVSITTNQAGEYTLAASEVSCHDQPSLVWTEKKRGEGNMVAWRDGKDTLNFYLISCSDNCGTLLTQFNSLDQNKLELQGNFKTTLNLLASWNSVAVRGSLEHV